MRTASDIAIGMLVLVACGAVAAATPPPDHIVPSWYLGMPVVSRSFEHSAQGFSTEAEIPAPYPYRKALVYLVGIADTSIGASPAQRISMPERTLAMPGHQSVLSCVGAPQSPVLGIAYFVIPGPAANAHNLRADPMPDSSVAGAPLATAIRIGPTWIPLTSHVVIEQGLALNLLRLRFFGANPISWATPSWVRGYPPAEEHLFPPCREQSRAAAAVVLR